MIQYHFFNVSFPFCKLIFLLCAMISRLLRPSMFATGHCFSWSCSLWLKCILVGRILRYEIHSVFLNDTQFFPSWFCGFTECVTFRNHTGKIFCYRFSLRHNDFFLSLCEMLWKKTILAGWFDGCIFLILYAFILTSLKLWRSPHSQTDINFLEYFIICTKTPLHEIHLKSSWQKQIYFCLIYSIIFSLPTPPLQTHTHTKNAKQAHWLWNFYPDLVVFINFETD